MKLSTRGRYAVMAMADLASIQGEKPVTLADVATRQEISLSYLEQLFAQLRRAGLVSSMRGPGGGYKLAQPLASTRISDIVLAVDEPLEVTRCGHNSVKGCKTDGSRCITHDLWSELSRQINLFLSSITLEDVINRQVLGKAAIFPAAESINEPEALVTAGE